MNDTPAANRVLVIDDERAIRRYLRAALLAHHYTVYEAATAQEGLNAVILHRPDIIILDLGLPDMSGLDVTTELREWSQIPIIILSVQDQETDKIAALDAGANDYLTKPFGIGELMARMRVALRQISHHDRGPIFTTADLSVDLARRLVKVADEEIQLTPTEYDILKVLVADAGKVLTHQHILRQVWGLGYADALHLLRVNISNLRHKIEPDPNRPRYIVTEPGVGYRLRTEV